MIRPAIWACGMALLAAGSLPAAEIRGVPDDAVAVLEVQRPMRLARHPLVSRFWDVVRESDGVRRAMQAPEFDPLRQGMALLEAAAGTDGPAALDRLTAGGVTLAVVPGPPPRGVLILTSDDPALLARVTERAREEIVRRLPDEQRAAGLPTESHGDTVCYKVGPAWYAVQGARLVVASDPPLLQQTLDRPAAAPVPTADDAAPLARLWVDLEVVRHAPQLEKALALPSNDPGQVAFLGGWLDLLRQSEELTAELSLGPATADFTLRLPAGTGRTTPALRGFFITADAQAAPLLRPPGTIYTATWYRDYAALWEARAQLATAEKVATMEKADADSRQQLSVFKLDLSLSDIVRQLGPHFRVVAARQQETGYRVPVTDRLPAAALVIDVRDEAAFKAKVTPLLRAVGLLAAFRPMGPKMRPAAYRGAQLTGLWFRDDEEAAAQGNRGRFNFSPTWTLTRGHLVLGSTHELVCRIIDQLDQPADTDPATTERQWLSLTELAAATNDLRETITRGLVFDQGLTLDEAEREAGILERAIQTLGEITTRTTFDRDRFESRWTIGAE